MQFLFSAMHAIAAKGGEGLRPELARALEQVKDNRAFGATLGGAANRNGPEFVPCGRPEGLNVETLGPISLVQHGRKCSIHFEPNGTVTIVLGMRTYGRGYASAYFGSLVAARLGIPFNRIRLCYSRVHPAVKISFRELSNVPSRDSVGALNVQIGYIIESLCDKAIAKDDVILQPQSASR